LSDSKTLSQAIDDSVSIVVVVTTTAFISEMEPGLRVTGHWVSDFGRVGSRVSVSDPMFDPVVSFNMCVYRGVVSTFYRITPSRQTNIRGFGSVPVTALLVYLLQSVPVIFTYLRADCPCDVTTVLDLGRVGSPSQKPSDRVPGQKS